MKIVQMTCIPKTNVGGISSAPRMLSNGPSDISCQKMFNPVTKSPKISATPKVALVEVELPTPSKRAASAVKSTDTRPVTVGTPKAVPTTSHPKFRQYTKSMMLSMVRNCFSSSSEDFDGKTYYSDNCDRSKSRGANYSGFFNEIMKYPSLAPLP